jgi:hypothetical protein
MMMRPIPEAADVTEADRQHCRALIEAAGFHAVDYEEDGAAWERMLPEGDCLVLAVRETSLSASLRARSGRSHAS